MTTTTLYSGMGASLTPIYVEGRTESLYVRIEAGEGKMLKKGDITTVCVDVLSADIPNWQEVDYYDYSDVTDTEALTILLGGAE